MTRHEKIEDGPENPVSLGKSKGWAEWTWDPSEQSEEWKRNRERFERARAPRGAAISEWLAMEKKLI